MSKNYNNGKKPYIGIDTVPKEDNMVCEEVNKQSDAQNVNEVLEEDISINAEISTLEGVVSGCDRLNVRNRADIDSEVLSIIKKDAPVIIYPAKSNDEWLSVCTKSKIKGYCMKKFITIKES